MPTIRNVLAWRINEGSSIHIGLDPWLGCGSMFGLPPDLIKFLTNRNIIVNAHVFDLGNSSIFNQAWLLAEHLRIHAQWKEEWEGYIVALIESYVCRKDGADALIFTPTEHGTYSSKAGYPIIHIAYRPLVLMDLWGKIWKLKAPPRTKLSMWNFIRNKTQLNASIYRQAYLVCALSACRGDKQPLIPIFPNS